MSISFQRKLEDCIVAIKLGLFVPQSCCRLLFEFMFLGTDYLAKELRRYFCNEPHCLTKLCLLQLQDATF